LVDTSEDTAHPASRTVPNHVVGTSITLKPATCAPITPDGWALTRRVSPRDVVRLAVADDAGRPQNLYPTLASIDGPAPRLPWAVPLTDEHRQFHLVAFDLDLGHGDGNVIRDTQQLTGWLHQLHIEHTVAQSGPSGGRHVWLALSEPATAELVSMLADHAAGALPTLDLSALKNAVWGSMRPPGAPHRSGGHSIILSGPDEPLRPAVSVEQLARLIFVIAAAAAARQPRPEPLPAGGPLPVDADGHRYLPGPRRPLPPASARALDAAPADASAAAFTVLLGAARAHWHLADIVNVLHRPGLEHLRTERHPTGRHQRSPRERQRLLARQWNKAVNAVHRTADTTHRADDATFAGRATAITAHVVAVQARADAAPGRWNTRTGPATRRVLDALCLLALNAVTPSVEADLRRVAELTGLGRETVRVRLHQLAADGWITLTTPAAGSRGHVWTLTKISPPPGQSSYPQASVDTRSQGVPPPRPARTDWQNKLHTRLADQAHDVFTPRALGHTAGQLYAELTAHPTSTAELSTKVRRPPEHVTATLADLLAAHLVVRTRLGWRRADSDRRTNAAKRLGVDGTLAARRSRYEHERLLWAWWCDELDWMRLPRTDPAKKRRGRLAVGQLTLDGGRPRGRYPRDTTGRADHRHAADLAA
jgi:hypothetical protein